VAVAAGASVAVGWAMVGVGATVGATVGGAGGALQAATVSITAAAAPPINLRGMVNIMCISSMDELYALYTNSPK
jgi:hypothetical protein